MQGTPIFYSVVMKCVCLDINFFLVRCAESSLIANQLVFEAVYLKQKILKGLLSFIIQQCYAI